MNIIVAALLGAMVYLLPAEAGAQERPSGRIPTVTRLVKIVAGLEEELSTATRRGNAEALAQMLTKDFEMRGAASPGVPLPRADWVRESIARPEPAGRIEQIAVHEFGEILIASFLRPRAQAPKQRMAPGTLTIDVWQRAGDSWKLAVRYSGDGSTSRPR